MRTGTFKNGDKWQGYSYQEGGAWWFRATDQNGNEYDTQEVPTEKLDITIVRFSDGSTQEDIDNVISDKDHIDN